MVAAVVVIGAVFLCAHFGARASVWDEVHSANGRISLEKMWWYRSLSDKTCFVLSFGQVVECDVSGVKCGDNLLRSIGDADHLRKLRIESSEVSDRGAEALGSAPTLMYLDLGGNPLTDKGVRDLLMKAPAVSEVCFSHTQISVDTLVTVASRGSIATASLRDNTFRFTAASIRDARGPSYNLDLSNTDVDVSLFAVLPKDLRVLNVSKCLQLNHDIDVTVNCTMLEHLFCDEIDVGTGLAHILCQLERLKTLSLQKSRIAPAAMSCLRKLQHLTKIDLSGCKIDQEIWSNVSDCAPLRLVDLRGCDLMDIEFTRGEAAISLECLDLRGALVREGSVDAVLDSGIAKRVWIETAVGENIRTKSPNE